jgi:hypothetical protein
MKRGIILFLLLIPFAFAATPYNPSLGSHPLQQLTTDETGTTSVDADADGIIDRAETVGSLDGDASLGDGTTNAVLKVKGATTLWSAIDFYSGSTAIWGVGRNAVQGATYDDEDFYIDRSGVRRAFTIDKDTLNVGIDTDNPQAKLDINGNIRLSSANPEIELNSGGPRLRVPLGNTLAIHTGGGFGSSANERMRITSGGNVGIGTANPLAQLHIASKDGSGNAYNGISIGSSPDAGKGGSTELNFVGHGTSGDGAYIDYSRNNNRRLVFRSIETGADGSESGYSTVMTLDSNGNVGIGTLCINGDCRTSWPPSFTLPTNTKNKNVNGYAYDTISPGCGLSTNYYYGSVDASGNPSVRIYRPGYMGFDTGYVGGTTLSRYVENGGCSFTWTVTLSNTYIPIELQSGSGIYGDALGWKVSGTGVNTGGWDPSGSDSDSCQYPGCVLQ